MTVTSIVLALLLACVQNTHTACAVRVFGMCTPHCTPVYGLSEGLRNPETKSIAVPAAVSVVAHVAVSIAVSAAWSSAIGPPALLPMAPTRASVHGREARRVCTSPTAPRIVVKAAGSADIVVSRVLRSACAVAKVVMPLRSKDSLPAGPFKPTATAFSSCTMPSSTSGGAVASKKAPTACEHACATRMALCAARCGLHSQLSKRSRV